MPMPVGVAQRDCTRRALMFRHVGVALLRFFPLLFDS